LCDENRPGRISIAKVLRRIFDDHEIDDLKRSFGQKKDLAHSPRAMLPEIVRLRQQGKSLSEIGRILGFTHQAIGRALCEFDSTYVPGMTFRAEVRSHTAENDVQEGQS
jgi:hypothetical protein